MRRSLVAASIIAALVSGSVVGLTTAATADETPTAASSASSSPAEATASSPAEAEAEVADQQDRRICPAVPEGQMSCLLETAPTTTDTDPGAAAAGPADDLSPQLTSYGLEPSDFRSAYSLGAQSTAAPGSGPTVAIVDAFDAPQIERDLATYRSTFGLGTCSSANGCFTKVQMRSGLGTDVGWAQESTADAEMVSAVCPQCRILLVEAASASADDLGAAVNRAVALGALYVSNSYGGAMPDATAAADEAQYFTHPGVVVTAASGDSGFESGGAIFPAASRYVTAVGGTVLQSNGSAWTEAAWSGSGSGCSTYSAKAVWQTDGVCARRTVADVSAAAYGITTRITDTSGTAGWASLGGTSLSSPIIAAVYALAGTPAAGSWPAQYPYQHSSALRDVTSGTTGSCSVRAQCAATAGYDAPTGLGTPIGLTAFRAGTVSATRVAGTNAYDTAARTVALGGYSPGLATVYVATRAGFADALAGGAAAGADGAPILLVASTAIPAQTAAALRTLRPQRIVVLGGTSAVSSGVASGLAAYAPSVVRYAGANRWATSAAISSRAFAAGASTVYVATGTNFPDALSGAALAATSAHRGPILLVPGTSVPDVVATELARLRANGLTRVVVLGGTSVVSGAVATALGRYGTVTRIAGTSRFGTSVAISQTGYSRADTVYVATGSNFPDALAGAPVAARLGAPVLLVTPGSTPGAIQAEIDRLGATRVVVLGGTAAVGNGAAATL